MFTVFWCLKIMGQKSKHRGIDKQIVRYSWNVLQMNKKQDWEIDTHKHKNDSQWELCWMRELKNTV